MNTNIKLAGYSLSDLLSVYRQDLFDCYLPYLDQHIFDDERGGFICHTDRSGKQVSTHKRAWYDGRGVWVYCSLYRHFGNKSEYLEKAAKTVDFLLEMELDEYPFWPWGYTDSGEALKDQNADIYGSLFVAEGLVSYAAVTEKLKYWEKAKDILVKCVAEYDLDTYKYIPHYQTTGNVLSAPRVLGHWMIFLNLCGHLLSYQQDEEVKNISDRCIEALLEHHLQPDFNLMIEYLNHDLSTPESPHDQFAYTGHGIEVLWMLMGEADRRGDEVLFNRVSDLFKRHVEASWDYIYGGFFHELTHITQNNWNLDKVLWAQEEVLIGLIIMIEKDRDEWAIRWFDRVYPCIREKFILHDHPSKLWVNGGDRLMKEYHQVDRFENYHHPRHLMMNILALERMLKS